MYNILPCIIGYTTDYYINLIEYQFKINESTIKYF